MDFMKSIRPYLTAFNILGMSPLLVSTNDGESKNWRTSKILVLIHAVIGSTLALSCIQMANFGNNEYQWSRTDIVIMNIVVVCEMLRIIFIVIQCIFSKQTLIEICYTFRMLQGYYNMHLHHPVGYQPFTQQYNRKVVFIMCGFIPTFMIFVWDSWWYGLMPVYMHFKILQIMTLASYLHIIFYVDILSFHLAELNVVIERDETITNQQPKHNIIISVISKQASSNMAIRKRWRRYKTVHFHLWEVAQRINAFFGWSMVAILLHGFVDFVYSSYWMIQEFQPPVNIPKVIREYS